VVSSAATLTISSPPAITLHPSNVSACSGETAVLEIMATGTGLTYQWQVNKGNGFENLSHDIAYRNVTSRALLINEVIEPINAYQYRCIISGQCSATSQAATIKVKRQAVISSQPSDAISDAGSHATFSVDATGDDLTYQWQENKGGGFVNIVNNEIFKNAGTSTLTISNLPLQKNGALYRCVVSGLCDPVVSLPAKLVVKDPKPVITSLPVTTVSEDSLYEYRLAVTNATGNPLTYSVIKKPEWLTFNPITQLLSGVPSNDHVGDHSVTLQVSNGLSYVEQSFVITVVNTNDGPLITSKAVVVAREDSDYKYVFHGYDVDKGDLLTWTILSKPSWLTFDAAMSTLKGTPGDDAAGEYQVTIQLSDGKTFTTQSFSLVVENVNDAPVFISTPLMEIDEDNNYSYNIVAQDADQDDILTYSIVQKPGWLYFNNTTKVVNGKPSNDHRGSHVVKIQVSDGKAVVHQMFRILVKNVNDAPIILSQGTTTVNQNENYSYKLEARDDDGDELVFNATVMPQWLSFDPATRTLSGAATAAGNYQITLKVSDGKIVTEQSFTINVIQPNIPPVIIPPVVTPPVGTPVVPEIKPTDVTLNNNIFESTVASLYEIGTFTTTDEDLSTHVYQLVSGEGDKGNVFFTIVNDRLQLKSQLAQPGEFSIRVRSTNSYGNSIEKVFLLEAVQPETSTVDAGPEIPTTFSPNADGINDRWVIKSLKGVKNVFIQVLDRSGVQLYGSTDPEQGWDGVMPGGHVMEGPFFYVVTVGREVKKGVLIVIK
jgi:gliding motility-associated-like protein